MLYPYSFVIAHSNHLNQDHLFTLCRAGAVTWPLDIFFGQLVVAWPIKILSNHASTMLNSMPETLTDDPDLKATPSVTPIGQFEKLTLFVVIYVWLASRSIATLHPGSPIVTEKAKQRGTFYYHLTHLLKCTKYFMLKAADSQKILWCLWLISSNFTLLTLRFLLYVLFDFFPLMHQLYVLDNLYENPSYGFFTTIILFLLYVLFGKFPSIYKYRYWLI